MKATTATTNGKLGSNVNKPSRTTPTQSPRPLSMSGRYGKTDHATAEAYRKKGWGAAGSRESWYSKLRFQGKFELPKDSACLQQPNERQ